MKSNYKKLGQFIQDVSVKNKNLNVELLLGVSITKRFIPSIANTIGTDMSKYKIVKRDQFAYGPVTSRNGEKISIALLAEDECLVSTSYTVFEIVDKEQLDPEYLMMWFRRSEFDRYARYMSHGTVRELFGWEEMCDIELPIPCIEKQREIVREYNVVNNRIVLNEQLTQKLEDTAQSIYKQWFVDFEFPIPKEYAKLIGKPDLNGKPYKSSGGEMQYCDDLEQEIPIIFTYSKLNELISHKKGNAFKSSDYVEDGVKIVKVSNFSDKTVSGSTCNCIEYSRKNEFKSYVLTHGDILISTVGSWPSNPASVVGQVVKVPKNMDGSLLNQNIVKLKPKEDAFQNTLMLALSRKVFSEYVVSGAQGSANQASVTLEHLLSYPLIQGDKDTRLSFSRIVKPLDLHRSNIEEENISLFETRKILLKKLAKA